MAYVLVIKNDQDQWEVQRYLTSIYNQYSPITRMTIGNVTYLTAAERLDQGFWISNDVYDGTGEFKELDTKVTTLDEVTATVTNTYTYKLMDLSFIRDEMKNRVRSYRSQLAQGTYTKDGKDYDLSTEGRNELQGLVLETLLDSSIQSVSIRLLSGEDVKFTAAELKEHYLAIALYRDDLFDIEAELIVAIDAAQDYDAIRTAATWGETAL